MIKSEKQYRITIQKLQEFKESLIALNSNDREDLMNSIMINSIKSQIQTFKRELSEYEFLKSTKPNVLVSKIEDLPQVLIKARISKGLTQGQLAAKMGLKEQQIQRYEATNYSTVSFNRLIGISKSIGLDFEDTKVTLNSNFITVKGFDSDLIQQATNKLHLRKQLLSI